MKFNYLSNGSIICQVYRLLIFPDKLHGLYVHYVVSHLVYVESTECFCGFKLRNHNYDSQNVEECKKEIIKDFEV